MVALVQKGSTKQLQGLVSKLVDMGVWEQGDVFERGLPVLLHGDVSEENPDGVPKVWFLDAVPEDTQLCSGRWGSMSEYVPCSMHSQSEGMIIRRDDAIACGHCNCLERNLSLGFDGILREAIDCDAVDVRSSRARSKLESDIDPHCLGKWQHDEDCHPCEEKCQGGAQTIFRKSGYKRKNRSKEASGVSPPNSPVIETATPLTSEDIQAVKVVTVESCVAAAPAEDNGLTDRTATSNDPADLTNNGEEVDASIKPKRRGYIRRKSLNSPVAVQQDGNDVHTESTAVIPRTWTSFLRGGVGYRRKSLPQTVGGDGGVMKALANGISVAQDMAQGASDALVSSNETQRKLDDAEARLVLLDIFGFGCPGYKAQENGFARSHPGRRPDLPCQSCRRRNSN